MRADVAFGSSLSGGMDSSAVTAVMNAHQHPTSTFSARFPSYEKDEGVFIDEVSSHFQTKQYNCFPDEEQLKSAIEKLVYHQEEPFQSGSIFAQYQVYALARQQNHLVLLDGQGADELLGGYFNYMLPYYYELSASKRKAFKEQMQTQQGVKWETSFSQALQFKFPKLFAKAFQLKQKLGKSNPSTLGSDLQKWNNESVPFYTSDRLKESLKHSLTSQGLEKLLRFSDRNAMAHSVEVRLPFLSHELVDFVMSLPSAYFFEAGWTKSILRHAMKEVIPTGITWRKDKVGFEAPHHQWTRSPLLEADMREARKQLTDRNWITEKYTSDWKVLILAKALEDER